ncbi:spore germination protein [Paenibacillus harenae]|uniref:spore germination protein n=1 Tax=Paenibacillus harenae TaxID=306543 RepID=UPI0003FEABDA|nr:spore germination protein [Paenibacillus harenae]
MPFRFRGSRIWRPNNNNDAVAAEEQQAAKQTVLTGSYSSDLQLFKTSLERLSDVVFREIQLAGPCRAVLIYLDGMADVHQIDTDILKALLLESGGRNLKEAAAEDLLVNIETQVVSAAQTMRDNQINNIIDHILSGGTALLLDGVPDALLISTQKWDKRSIEEPASEPVIRGPRDGFIENLRTNTSLIRRRLKDQKIKMEAMQIGRLSKTEIVLVYVEGIVDPKLLDELKQRLERIDIDAILESGYLEELIEDSPYSIFPQILNTERPDRVAGFILEGKIGILIDNTPFALVLPVTMFDLLGASEDYYQRYIPSTVTRWLRLWLAFSALVFPSLYIAILTFHQEMLPTSLLLSIAASREAVPFPAIIEAFIMELAFEGLREAGVRLPRPVGQAVSIVGALVIGQAAVQAGLVSASLVIVVSFTGIASFIFPVYSFGVAVRLLRFPLMIIAGTMGLFGILLVLLAILIHLVGLRSFGVPYMYPVAPLDVSGLKDVFIRAPWWAMRKRPKSTSSSNPYRMKRGLRPRKPHRKG